ncbi:MAG: hypothetical protein A2078_10730 [Nitrospirae bacterium GWC2_57_9]|nr:MAG: hypothetical protein A2078_10730 [Nitrospirae bacterium GWC2_57_9]
MDIAPKVPVKQSNDVVVDKPETSWSDLWKKEDYWAIWLGTLILVIGLFIYLPNPPRDMEQKLGEANAVMKAEAERAPFKTIAWHEANDAKGKLKASDEKSAKAISAYLAKPKGWTDSPASSFFMTADGAAAKREKATVKYEAAKTAAVEAKALAKAAEANAAKAGFKDDALNQQARDAIKKWRGAHSAETKAKGAATAKPYNVVGTMAVLCVGIALLFSIGLTFMGKSVKEFLVAFPVVFVLAALAYFLAGQANVKALGLEYVLWALVLGLLISNTVGTPKWLTPAVQTEYYIKTGLVLLGSSILFGKILLIGIPGIFVTWVVTPIVLIVTFWFGQKILKIESKTLNMTISADMSVCGVSAAIATAAACRAKKEELTLAVGISMAFTAVMLFAMPAVIKLTGMHHVLGGAWMGGTIDATGAVVAAGAILSPAAMHVAATIKMIQNVMIGVIAFGVATYWCMKVDCAEGTKLTFQGAAKEIWARFPKFVLGFVGASIFFSYIYQSLGSDAGKVMIDEGVVKGWASGLQGWFFCLAFVSIGLATNFKDVAKFFKGGKPIILYVCGQSFNLILTLAMAYLMFFVVFPEITEKLMAQ